MATVMNFKKNAVGLRAGSSMRLLAGHTKSGNAALIPFDVAMKNAESPKHLDSLRRQNPTGSMIWVKLPVQSVIRTEPIKSDIVAKFNAEYKALNHGESFTLPNGLVITALKVGAVKRYTIGGFSEDGTDIRETIKAIAA